MLCLRVGVKIDRFICIMFHSFLVLLREFISTFTFIFVFRYSELHCYIMNGRTIHMNTFISGIAAVLYCIVCIILLFMGNIDRTGFVLTV